MLVAETTWPDVGMAFVQVLIPLAAAIGAFFLQFRQLKEATTSSKAAAVTAGVAVTEIKANTITTDEVKRLVNGDSKWEAGRRLLPGETISGKLEAIHKALLAEIAALKEELALERANKKEVRERSNEHERG